MFICILISFIIIEQIFPHHGQNVFRVGIPLLSEEPGVIKIEAVLMCPSMFFKFYYHI